MSIQAFTSALRDKANSAAQANAKNLLNKLVASTTEAFKGTPLQRAASVLTEGKVKKLNTKGEYRDVDASKLFRQAGEAKGRTRLIVTEDDLNEMFTELNISVASSNGIRPIHLYLDFLATKYPNDKASRYEIYYYDTTQEAASRVLETSKNSKLKLKELLESIDIRNIVAVRGLTFSHANTRTHIAQFLHHINAFTGKSVAEIDAILGGLYERGHIYAQTTGRAMVSLAALEGEENILNEILKLFQLLDEGTTSLNSLDGKYSELLARSKKDFTGKSLYMNIQLQLIRNSLGTGNQDAADLSRVLSIVSLLQSLIQGSRLSSDGKRQLGKPAAESVKQFEKVLTNFNSKLEKYSKEINNILGNTTDPDFLIRLQTSDDLYTYVEKRLKSRLVGITEKNLKVDTGNKSISKSEKFKTKVDSPAKKVSAKLASLKADLQKAKNVLKANKRVSAPTPPVKGSIVDLNTLQDLLNLNIAAQIKQNMGDGSRRDVLNYRSGRFAESVEIKRLSQSRQGMITAFYSYMKNPYATFSMGGRQELPRSRDPKLLIAKSIREIAATQVHNRMRAVLL